MNGMRKREREKERERKVCISVKSVCVRGTNSVASFSLSQVRVRSIIFHGFLLAFTLSFYLSLLSLSVALTSLSTQTLLVPANQSTLSHAVGLLFFPAKRKWVDDARVEHENVCVCVCAHESRADTSRASDGIWQLKLVLNSHCASANVANAAAAAPLGPSGQCAL